jgi:hypothetical protein
MTQIKICELTFCEVRDQFWSVGNPHYVSIMGNNDLAVFADLHVGFQNVCTRIQRCLECPHGVFGMVQRKPSMSNYSRAHTLQESHFAPNSASLRPAQV